MTKGVSCTTPSLWLPRLWEVKNPTYLILDRIWDSWASCHVSCRWSGSWPGRMSWAECCKRGNSAGGSSAPPGWHFHWKATEGRKWVTTRSVAAAALIELIPKSIWWWSQSCSCGLYQLHCGLHIQQIVIRFATFFSNTSVRGSMISIELYTSRASMYDFFSMTQNVIFGRPSHGQNLLLHMRLQKIEPIFF